MYCYFRFFEWKRDQKVKQPYFISFGKESAVEVKKEDTAVKKENEDLSHTAVKKENEDLSHTAVKKENEDLGHRNEGLILTEFC